MFLGTSTHHLSTRAWPGGGCAGPGHARDLRHQLDRASALNPRAKQFEDLPFALDAISGEDALPMRVDVPFSDAKDALLRAFERRYLSAVMARSRGNQIQR